MGAAMGYTSGLPKEYCLERSSSREALRISVLEEAANYSYSTNTSFGERD